MTSEKRSEEIAATRGFGWDQSPPDPRDRLFPMARALEIVPVAAEERDPYRKWYSDVWTGDQGSTSQCTAYAMLHALHDGPFTHRPYWTDSPLVAPGTLYERAKCLDPWGCRASDDGTTMRAICTAAREAGFIGAYFWTESLDQALEYLATRGPLLLGSWWRSGMNAPREPDGLVPYDGRYLGGHATKIDEILWTHEQVGGKNSWGAEWGDGGRFRISFRDLETMLREGGELIAITEQRKAA